MPAPRLLTIGHSTRTLEAFLDACRAHSVTLVADVRRFPASRRHPHFAKAQLAAALAAAGIGYEHFEALGGRRSRRRDSPHTSWRIAAFAGYADHMDTPEFEAAAQQLLQRTASATVAVLCAEARPEECHRRLIADWLTARGLRVEHVYDEHRVVAHALTPFARVDGARLVYDG